MELSELANITPNYLNAVENGKNFPSPDVLQRIIEVLEILPYQLFLEIPGESKTTKQDEKNLLFKELNHLKQQFNHEFDLVLQKYTQKGNKENP
jgi:transcriptional regulator with XRE-family HTH domain